MNGKSKMRDGILQRGKNSWRIKFDLERNAHGKRETRLHTFRGTRKEAVAERVRLMHTANQGTYVDASKETMAEFLDRWDRDWATQHVSPKTIERYREIIKLQIKPH